MNAGLLNAWYSTYKYGIKPVYDNVSKFKEVVESLSSLDELRDKLRSEKNNGAKDDVLQKTHKELFKLANKLVNKLNSILNIKTNIAEYKSVPIAEIFSDKDPVSLKLNELDKILGSQENKAVFDNLLEKRNKIEFNLLEKQKNKHILEYAYNYIFNGKRESKLKDLKKKQKSFNSYGSTSEVGKDKPSDTNTHDTKKADDFIPQMKNLIKEMQDNLSYFEKIYELKHKLNPLKYAKKFADNRNNTGSLIDEISVFTKILRRVIHYAIAGQLFSEKLFNKSEGKDGHTKVTVNQTALQRFEKDLMSRVKIPNSLLSGVSTEKVTSKLQKLINIEQNDSREKHPPLTCKKGGHLMPHNKIYETHSPQAAFLAKVTDKNYMSKKATKWVKFIEKKQEEIKRV